MLSYSCSLITLRAIVVYYIIYYFFLCIYLAKPFLNHLCDPLFSLMIVNYEQDFSLVSLATIRGLDGVYPSSELSQRLSHAWLISRGVTLRPRRQVWEHLIEVIRSCLSTWKSKHLSLGGRFSLSNSIHSAILTYWMSIFKLSLWVIKSIDRIWCDFIWFWASLDRKGCRLVSWKRICRPQEQGGWGILN